MKKALIITALISTVAITAVQTASARPGNGYGRNLDCPGWGQTAQLDQATLDKIETFRNDNQGLRKQIVEKRAEKRALMRADNPDATQAAKVSGELFDLRQQLRDKAEAAGLSGYMAFGEGRGYGYASGKGRHHGGWHGNGPRGYGNF